MAEQTFSKQIIEPGYGDDKTLKYDFAGKNELTVTITLSEYRFLVQQQGAYEKKLSEKEKRNTELYIENNQLKQTIEALREGLSEAYGDGDA